MSYAKARYSNTVSGRGVTVTPSTMPSMTLNALKSSRLFRQGTSSFEHYNDLASLIINDLN
jgi:hypothetical protein